MPLETQRLQNLNTNDAANEQILPKGAILQNRYEIMRILGLGGMGSVYLARDLNFTKVERLCAIKEMISSTPDPAVRKMALSNFEREANTLASINHPAIVKIYDYFSEGNRSYLVMEYVEGQNLEQIINDLDTHAFLDEARVLRWGIQICDILTFLHEHRTPIVYRDLKPPNLILRVGSDPEQLVLIDFGIAKAFQEGQKGTMMGTEGYSPPEQYRGIASPQGDVYALGATLHHILTKRDPKLEPPFTFHEAPLRQFNPGISEQTEHVVMKALNYEMKERYASAAQMKAALQHALKSLTHSGGAHSPSPTDGTSQTRPASQAPTVAFGQNVSPNAATTVIGNQAAPSAWDAPNINTGQGGVIAIWAFKAEDEIRSSPTMGDGLVYIGAYDNNVYALDAKNGSFVWKYATDGGIASTPFFYKDRVIFGSEDRLIYAVTSHRGKILWTCPTEGKVRSSVRVDFEHAFVGSDDNRLYAINAQSGRVIWRFEAAGPIRSTPIIDTEIVYVGSDDGHLYAVNMQTGKMKWKFRTNRGIISSPTIYEDLILFGSQDWTFYALNKTSSWSIWRTRTNQAIISSPTVKDGIVYFGSVDGNLYALDATSGRTIWKFRAGSHIVSRPAVSDNAIFFGTNNGEVISLHLKSGKERWRFQTGGPVPSSPLLGEGMVYIGSTDHNLYALPA